MAFCGFFHRTEKIPIPWEFSESLGKNPRRIPFDWKNWEDRKIKNFPKMKRILSQDNLATYNVTY